MPTVRTILLAAATASSLTGPALAGDGDQGGPFPMWGRAQVFAFGPPRLDVGSESYPSTNGLGAGEEDGGTNHVLRSAVPAYQRRFDTGSQAYPDPQ